MEKTKLACPHCRADMKPVFSKKYKVEADKCPDCTGMFFFSSQVRPYIQDPNVLLKFENEGLMKVKDHREKTRQCAICNEKDMDKVRFPCTKSIIDYCEKCKSIFFDKGELFELSKARYLGSTEEFYNKEKAKVLIEMIKRPGKLFVSPTTINMRYLIASACFIILILDQYYEAGILEAFIYMLGYL
jgi:Zn-finger nucleic acid-binding protein